MPRARPPSPSRSPSPSSSPRARTPPSPPPRARAAANPTSTLLHHSIPPFYACYLLRSFAARRAGAATYIGSTPDPPRRWRQHMGLVKGGAFKTRLGRPWEMEALVSGFPTKLQALQFEWAWQNPHASRLLRGVPKADSAAPPASLTRGKGRGKGKEREDGGGDGETGKVKVKDKLTAADKPAAAASVAQFPRGALSNRPLSKIQVLQYMLTSAPWRSFPLRVTLLSLDAQAWWDAARRLGPVLRTEAGVRKWEREREREGDGAEDAWGERAQRLDEVRVVLRREGVDGARLVRAGEKAEGEEVERLRVDDGEFFDAHWAKWAALSDDPAALQDTACDLCRKPVDTSDHLSFHLCTASAPGALAPCLAVFHPLCLSAHLLSPHVPSPPPPTSASSSAAPPAVLAPPLLPTTGPCPTCGGALHWADLVRGSYRRGEELEGRRKKRTRQRGRQVAVGGTRRKGEVLPVEKEDDEEEEEEAFRFSGSGSDDPSDAESVDLGPLDDDGADSDAERSFARLDAAAQALGVDGGALCEGEEVRAPWDEDGDAESLLGRPAPPAALAGKPRARAPRAVRPPPSTPAGPRKRGRPREGEGAATDADGDGDGTSLRVVRSPWSDQDHVFDARLAPGPATGRLDALPPAPPLREPRAAAAVLPSPDPAPLPPKRRGRPPKAAAAGARTLVGAFGSTKAALSTASAAAAGKRGGGGADSSGRATLGRGEVDEEEDALVPPGLLGVGGARPGEARQARTTKREAYIELSD